MRRLLTALALAVSLVFAAVAGPPDDAHGEQEQGGPAKKKEAPKKEEPKGKEAAEEEPKKEEPKGKEVTKEEEPRGKEGPAADAKKGSGAPMLAFGLFYAADAKPVQIAVDGANQQGQGGGSKGTTAAPDTTKPAAPAPDPAKVAAADAAKAAQAAKDTAQAAADMAAVPGASYAQIVAAMNARIRFYAASHDSVSAAAAQAIADAVAARATIPNFQLSHLVDAARAAAATFQVPPAATTTQATKTAPIQKPSDATPPTPAPLQDYPPASARAAFASVLPIGANPAMTAAGDFEYSLHAVPALGTPACPAAESGADILVPLDWRRPGTAPDRPGAPARPDQAPDQAGDDPRLAEVLRRMRELQAKIDALEQRRPRPDAYRRIGFFAVRYTPSTAGDPNQNPPTAGDPNRSRRTAAWYGARAVQTQLVSLASPGQGHSVALQPRESLVIGICSFRDDGTDPYFGWLAVERDPSIPQHWKAFLTWRRPAAAGGGWDVLENGLQTVDPITDLEMILNADLPLASDIPSPYLQVGVAPTPQPGLLADYPLKPVARIVISGDIVTFSIEVRDGTPSTGNERLIPPPASFHLAGQYRSWKDISPAVLGSMPPAPEDIVHYGALVLRYRGEPDATLVDRAAAYGADVLRRRGETLQDWSRMRTERLGQDRHLVLFVRNKRSGDTSWLAISGNAPDARVSSRILGNLRTPAEGTANTIPDPPAPWLPPAYSNHMPAESFPLYVGGSQGYRFVEVMLIRQPATFSPTSSAPPSLFDASYLFVLPR